MTSKMKLIFAMMMAVMLLMFVSAVSFAEDTGYNEDDLVEIDDDWGYISPEVIEQHTPEMTQEFIHADDAEWHPELAEQASAEPAPAPEVVAGPEAAPVSEEAPATEAADEPAHGIPHRELYAPGASSECHETS